jgi:hypothetical protein
MHIELVVPGLLPARAAAPALELLLARGRRPDCPPATLEHWYGDAFALDGPIPAGALSALAAGLDPGADYWLRADPVHLRAGREGVLLLPSAGFSIAADEAAALADTLNRHFAPQLSVHAMRPDIWCLRAGEALPMQAKAPLAIAGRSIDAELPDKRFHALLNEMQMALYDHPVNTARDARGEPMVNGVWPWGAGRLPEAISGPWQSVSAEDPVALGLARVAGMRQRAPGSGAAAWLERAPEEGRHLVVIDSLRGAQALGDAAAHAQRLHDIEAAWFAPLLAALRAGRIGMISLCVPEAGLVVETARPDLRRFWRRVRPLSAYAMPEPA